MADGDDGARVGYGIVSQSESVGAAARTASGVAIVARNASRHAAKTAGPRLFTLGIVSPVPVFPKGGES